MPFVTNPEDGVRIFHEDRGGGGTPVVVHGGLLDTVELLREAPIVSALDPDEFRVVIVDHRGIGHSDAPHDPADYAMRLRVADAIAVLDALDIDRAHLVGTSYGGRLCFGVGQLAPERVRSLVVGGQQPYVISPDGPLFTVVVQSLAASAEAGSMEPFVAALESDAGGRIPDPARSVYLRADPVAMQAASTMMVDEGDIASDLGDWPFPVLVFVGAGDADMLPGARRAAEALPDGRLLVLDDVGHVGAHMDHATVVPAVLEALHRA